MKIRFKEKISNLVIYHYIYIQNGEIENGRIILKEDNDKYVNNILNRNNNVIKVDDYYLYDNTNVKLSFFLK